MAYGELVKNFNRIREYMREFYVYGFKSRGEFTRKSARSYDDEKRRIESWLGDYMKFRQTPEGKNVFLSIDSRILAHNPLYKAWKTKSFTDGDITFHFVLFDILSEPDDCMTIGEIIERADAYRLFDESTVRKKLKGYVNEGLLTVEKRGKKVYYRRAGASEPINEDVLDYFSEVFPCGVIGSFLLDKEKPHTSRFAFKHHYITGTMDSEVLYAVFDAITAKRSITFKTIYSQDLKMEQSVIPLKVMVSVQNGRQYLMAYVPEFRRIQSLRIDHIVLVKIHEVSECFDEMQRKFDGMRSHMWGVSTQSSSAARMEHVDFTIRYGDGESYIKRRLEREKRCGIVEHLDEHTSRFSADVFDACELIPWIRTFICRITEIHFSNKILERQFWADIQDMYELYGIGEQDS